MKCSIFLPKLIRCLVTYHTREKQKSEGSPQQTPMCERVIDEHLSGSSSCSITLHGEDRNKRVVDPVIHIQS